MSKGKFSICKLCKFNGDKNKTVKSKRLPCGVNGKNIPPCRQGIK